jgi:hypothetical protein
MTNVTSESLDHLQMRVQRESEKGSFLFSLLHDHSDPFFEAQRTFGNLIRLPPNETCLRVCLHFCPDSAQARIDACLEARGQIVEMSSCLYAVCEIFFDRNPFQLVCLVDPQTPTDKKRSHAQSVVAMKACCRDKPFTQKIVDVHNAGDAILSDSQLLQCLKCFGKEAMVENIGLERLLSLIRASFQPRVPTAGRLLSAGFMTQWMRLHKLAGGNDPRTVTRKHLQRRSVLTRALIRKRKKKDEDAESARSCSVCPIEAEGTEGGSCQREPVCQ